MIAIVHVQRIVSYALGGLCMTMVALGFCAAATMGATRGVVPIGQAVEASIRLHLRYRWGTLATRQRFTGPPPGGLCRGTITLILNLRTSQNIRGLRIEGASLIICRISVLQRHLARLTRLSVWPRSESSTPSCRLSCAAFAGLLVWEQRGYR